LRIPFIAKIKISGRVKYFAIGPSVARSYAIRHSLHVEREETIVKNNWRGQLLSRHSLHANIALLMESYTVFGKTSKLCKINFDYEKKAVGIAGFEPLFL
jgi:hypothetical protein